MFIKRSDLNV